LFETYQAIRLSTRRRSWLWAEIKESDWPCLFPIPWCAPRWPYSCSRPSMAPNSIRQRAPASSPTSSARLPTPTWIEEIFNENLTGGCGNGNYCPDNPVNRGQMAVFLVKTFGLQLYGP